MDLLQKLNPSIEPSDDWEIRSIHDHLIKLLNSRKKLLGHLPDYGLSDFASYEGKFGIIYELQREIKEIIEKFEPRLMDVGVEPDREAPELYKDFVANFNISAVLKSDPKGKNLFFCYRVKLDGQVQDMD